MVSSPIPASGPRSSAGASGRRAAAAASNRSTERSVPFTRKRRSEKLDVGLGRLEQPRREAPAFLDDLLGGLRHHDGAEPHGAAGVGAAADGSEVGIAGDQSDLLEADTEPFDDELGEARLVTLAGRQRAEHDVDAAVGTHRDLGALARHAGVELDVVGEADAAVPATLARREAALLEPVPVGPGDHAILGGRVVAAVVDEAE